MTDCIERVGLLVESQLRPSLQGTVRVPIRPPLHVYMVQKYDHNAIKYANIVRKKMLLYQLQFFSLRRFGRFLQVRRQHTDVLQRRSLSTTRSVAATCLRR